MCVCRKSVLPSIKPSHWIINSSGSPNFASMWNNNKCKVSGAATTIWKRLSHTPSSSDWMTIPSFSAWSWLPFSQRHQGSVPFPWICTNWTKTDATRLWLDYVLWYISRLDQYFVMKLVSCRALTLAHVITSPGEILWRLSQSHKYALESSFPMSLWHSQEKVL